MNRRGYDEQTWFTFSYSPVRDDNGTVAGIFCARLRNDLEGARGARASRDERNPRTPGCRGSRRAQAARRHRRTLGRVRARGGSRLPGAGDQPRSSQRIRADLWCQAGRGRPPAGRSVRHAARATGRRSKPSGDRRWPAKSSPRPRSLATLPGTKRAPTSFASIRSAIPPATGSAPISSSTTSPRACTTGNACGAPEEALRRVAEARVARAADGWGRPRFQQPPRRLRERPADSGAEHQRCASASACSTRCADSVARGTGLTRHLLAFSRRRPVNPESIDVPTHLLGMRSMLDGSLGGHIHVDMRLDDERCSRSRSTPAKWSWR